MIKHTALKTAALVIAMVSTASAQDSGASWRIGASAGAYAPLSAMIKTADQNDTRLGAGPAFSVEPQYVVSNSISIYANGTFAFGTLRLGSSIRPTVVGPSDQVMLATGTGGVILSPGGLVGENFRPTLRIGGGLKFYSFDLAETDNQVRPNIDAGLGFRGAGIGALEVMAEARVLLSSFDQSALPTRGIATQTQRQNDLVLSIGIGYRPRSPRM